MHERVDYIKQINSDKKKTIKTLKVKIDKLENKDNISKFFLEDCIETIKDADLEIIKSRNLFYYTLEKDPSIYIKERNNYIDNI